MIAALPGGFHHRVSERGRNLSAGQRQLLALARAELADPDVLILDEATSALDLATEAAVTRAEQARRGGRGGRSVTGGTGAVGAAGVSSAADGTGRPRLRTTLVVAHRLTTAARADRILVLDGGRIVEDGDHAALLAAGGTYAALWEAFAAGHEQPEPQEESAAVVG